MSKIDLTIHKEGLAHNIQKAKENNIIIPTIGYGPSLESLAHVRDEYIEIDQLLKSCKCFYSILTQLTHESA